MKRLLTIVLLLSAQAAISSYTLPQETCDTVYICVSPTAHAYHISRECRGLKKCTHQIKEVSVEKAVAKGYKKCKVCGGKNNSKIEENRQNRQCG